MRATGVNRVVILHGTFAGTDATGLLMLVGRLFPECRDGLGRISKRIVDGLMGDNGNFMPEYARLFGEALNSVDPRGASVKLLNWTGENHHLGRAHAAICLIDELARSTPTATDRVMVWGHSHGGNALALASRLIGGERAEAEAFFDAARCFYRRLFGEAELSVWRRVEELLRSGRHALRERPIDVATFGTPPRYAWCEAGVRTLMHFVNHRPIPGLPPRRTAPPRGIADVLNAAAGDYVQQFGIAGTNAPPAVFLWRAWLADRRLNALLQGAELSPRNLRQRIAAGVRTAESGRTILVDYGPPQDGIERHLAGHAVYTRPAWLPFHVAQAACELASPDCGSLHEPKPPNVTRADRL